MNNATVRVAHVKYDSFGQITAITDNNGNAIATALTRYLFTAREWDYDTKLQYNRARWYNPATGRWMSEEALSHAGSSDGDAPDPLRFVYSAASPTPGGGGAKASERRRKEKEKKEEDQCSYVENNEDSSDNFYRGSETSSTNASAHGGNHPTSGGWGRMGFFDNDHVEVEPALDGRVHMYYVDSGWFSSEPPVYVGTLDPETGLVERRGQFVPHAGIQEEIAGPNTTANWNEYFDENSVDLGSSTYANLTYGPAWYNNAEQAKQQMAGLAVCAQTLWRG